MIVSACFRSSQIPLKNNLQWLTQPQSTFRMNQVSIFPLRDVSTELLGQRVEKVRGKLSNEWNFVGGSRIVCRPNFALYVPYRRSFGISASWFTSSQIATCVFTLGTAAVLPFYTLMVLAPRAKLTKRLMESKVPYVVLGLLYAYLLYLSWTPDTIRLMFASKYWLPELRSIAKIFSSEMTLASAWIHLLGVDLFAASEVFHDGLENGIETRHSVSLCLFFCPIGILTHIITKTLTRTQKFCRHKEAFSGNR